MHKTAHVVAGAFRKISKLRHLQLYLLQHAMAVELPQELPMEALFPVLLAVLLL